MDGSYVTVDGRPAVRFERRLSHPRGAAELSCMSFAAAAAEKPMQMREGGRGERMRGRMIATGESPVTPGREGPTVAVSTSCQA